MMSQDRKQRILGRYVERSIALGLALLVPAVACMVAAAFVGKTSGVILASVGSTLGTVALLSFLYDPFLKDILAAEIFEKLGLRDSIVRAGLRDIGRSRDVRVEAFVGPSRTLSVLPLDPLEWPRGEFPEVLTVAIRQPLDVRVYVPKPDDTPSLQVLGDRLGVSMSELERRLRRLPDDLTNAWDAVPRHRDSRLEVLQYEGVPAVGLLLCDSCAIVETGPSLGYAPTDHTTSISVYEVGSPTADWVAAQLRFSDDRVPTPAGVRPLTPAERLPGRRAVTISPEQAPAEMPDGAEQDAQETGAGSVRSAESHPEEPHRA